MSWNKGERCKSSGSGLELLNLPLEPRDITYNFQIPVMVVWEVRFRTNTELKTYIYHVVIIWESVSKIVPNRKTMWRKPSILIIGLETRKAVKHQMRSQYDIKLTWSYLLAQIFHGESCIQSAWSHKQERYLHLHETVMAEIESEIVESESCSENLASAYSYRSTASRKASDTW